MGISSSSAAVSAKHARMGWSKTTRIKVMLAIDIVFFCIELGAGFAVHSLALMADAFHMVGPPLPLRHLGPWLTDARS